MSLITAEKYHAGGESHPHVIPKEAALDGHEEIIKTKLVFAEDLNKSNTDVKKTANNIRAVKRYANRDFEVVRLENVPTMQTDLVVAQIWYREKLLDQLDQNAIEIKAFRIEAKDHDTSVIFANTTIFFDNEYNRFIFTSEHGGRMILEIQDSVLHVKQLFTSARNGIGRHYMDMACLYATIHQQSSIALDACYGSWPFYYRIGMRPLGTCSPTNLKFDRKKSDQMLVFFALSQKWFSDDEIVLIKKIQNEILILDGLCDDPDLVYTSVYTEDNLRRNAKLLARGKEVELKIVGEIVAPIETKTFFKDGVRENSGGRIDMGFEEALLIDWRRRVSFGELAKGSLIYKIGNEKLECDLADLRHRLRALNGRYFQDQYKIL